MSLAVFLAQHNDVTAFDIDPGSVDQLSRRKSTVADHDIETFSRDRHLGLRATLDKQAAYADADFVFVATPANYDLGANHLDTSSAGAVVV